jgi:hypothetical protein
LDLVEVCGHNLEVISSNLAHESPKKHRNMKVVMKRRDEDKMVLSKDLRIKQAIEYVGKSLICRFHGRHILIQVDIAWPPTYSTGSKNNFHFGSFFTVFRVPNFWGHFEALNDVFWAR